MEEKLLSAHHPPPPPRKLTGGAFLVISEILNSVGITTPGNSPL